MTKEGLFLLNGGYNIIKVWIDHCKPLVSPNGEYYTYHSATSIIKEYPKKWYQLKPKTYFVDIKSGYRTTEYDFVYPHTDEKYMVIDNMVYLAHIIQITFIPKSSNNDEQTYNFYAYSEEEINETINKLKEQNTIDLEIVRNTSKKYGKTNIHRDFL